MTNDQGLNDLLNEIEGIDFIAEASAASNDAGFELALTSRPEFQSLLSTLLRLPEAGAEIFRRVVVLAQREVDRRYQNPYDTPLAAYLAALKLAWRPETRLAAHKVLSAPNIWRAHRLASQALFKEASENFDTETETVSLLAARRDVYRAATDRSEQFYSSDIAGESIVSIRGSRSTSEGSHSSTSSETGPEEGLVILVRA
jgi:hypothetical protein